MVWKADALSGATRPKGGRRSSRLSTDTTKATKEVNVRRNDGSGDSGSYQPSPSTSRVRNLSVHAGGLPEGSESSTLDKSYEKLDYASGRSTTRRESVPLKSSPVEWGSEQDLIATSTRKKGWGSELNLDVAQTGLSKSTTELFKTPLATRINYGSDLCMINDEISHLKMDAKPPANMEELTSSKSLNSKANFDSLEEVFVAFCQGLKRQSQASLFSSETQYMDGRTFQKFARDSNILDEKLTPTIVDLVFAKCKTVGTTKISSLQFYKAVKDLAVIRWPNHSPNDAFGLLYTFLTHSCGPKVNTNVKSSGKIAEGSTERLSKGTCRDTASELRLRHKGHIPKF